ncbi:hypothetical protein TNCV_1867141 [Trichonephila clavipes]|nr:hypothetical protein TNCV_1867141 [Trichonephila clavipes]
MVVARCWQQWITEKMIYRRGGSGRLRNTNACDNHAIKTIATSSLPMSQESVRCNLPLSRHPVVSKETLRRRLPDAHV